ncbi:MAG: hypothetical protein ACREIR_22685, partial [Geminicoccaceae bacterium]
PALPAVAAAEERAWADLVAARDTLWFARVRQLAAIDDLLPVLTPEVRPAPTAIVPDRVAAGSTTEVAIGGRRLAGASSLTFDRDDISARILSVTDDIVRAEVRLLSSVPPGPRNFTLTTPRARLESIAFGLSLLVEEPQVEPEPTLTSIRPDRVIAGTTTTLAVLGNRLEGASALTIEGGDIATAIVSATEGGVLAEVKASPNAAPGTRGFEVTTPTITLKSADFGLTLTVEQPEVQPALEAIEPDRVVAGRTIEATITGQGLEGATSVAFDHRGIVGSITAATEDKIAASVAVDATVPAGPHSFVVSTPRARLESAAFGLGLLIDDAPPQLSAIRPDRVAVGGAVTVVISGRGLDGASALTFAPTGVTAAIASATGSTVQAQVRVQAGAAPGPRSFSLTTPRGRLDSSTFGLAFQVEELPPLLSEIQPGQVTAGGTVTVTISGRGLEGARTLVFDRNDVTATIVAATATSVQARITAQVTALVGPRAFVLTTPRARLDSGAFVLSFTVLRRYGYLRPFCSPVVGGDLV